MSALACASHPHRHARAHDESSACRYRVAWSINPHMRIGASNFARAEAQHRAFVRGLRACGASVSTLPFVHGAHDSVFAKDNAVLDGRRAFLCAPTHEERRHEQPARGAALERLGFRVTASPAPFEGGDLVRVPGQAHAFLGHGFRSRPDVASPLGDFLEADVTPLRLVDPDFYHLDVALAVLEDGTALVHEPALAAESLARLRHHPAIARVVPIPRADAMMFGLNFVQVGHAVVTGSRAPAVEAALRDRGLSIVHTPLREFQLAGGSAACLVARVTASTGVSEKKRAA